jgi:hypothetical protein
MDMKNFIKLMRNYRLHKQIGKYLAVILLILAIITVLVLEVFSRGAAMIFNQAMEGQDVLRGTITVEKLLADLTGHVSFENLEWKDVNGNTLLKVPSGSFQARPWDVVTNNMKATTIQELTLNDAEVSIHLADDMQVDLFAHRMTCRKSRMSLMMTGAIKSVWSVRVRRSVRPSASGGGSIRPIR